MNFGEVWCKANGWMGGVINNPFQQFFFLAITLLNMARIFVLSLATPILKILVHNQHLIL